MKNKLKKVLFAVLSVITGFITAFWVLGSIILIVSDDVSNKISGVILYLFFALLFGILFYLSIKHYLVAKRLSKEVSNVVPQISCLKSENVQQCNVSETGQQQDLFINPSELLLMKIDSVSTSGVYFENVACAVLKANGFQNVSTTQTSNDYGIDILAEKDGITYAIQCKCYSSPVGNKAVQEAYSGKVYYNCMVAVVLTNNTFTKAAIETAKATQVMLWDRSKLLEMISKLDETELKKIINSN